jgi:flagella basal body P-ring formation protein FlgA
VQIQIDKLALSVFSVILIGSSSFPALADAQSVEFELLSDIRETAEKFALEQITDRRLTSIEAQAAQMDSRLQLQKCSQPLQATATRQSVNASRTTIGIRCVGSKPWTVYVPVSIEAEAFAVFTSQALAREDDLLVDKLEIRAVPINRLPNNYISELKELEGMALSRAVNSGVVLTRSLLKPRQLVQQGQEVLILAQVTGIQVRMKGIAMKNGISGQLIPVRNNSSGRIVEATILNGSTVLVKM